MDPTDPRALDARFAGRVEEFARIADCSFHRELTARIVTLLEQAPAGRLLELGCATGSLLAAAGDRHQGCVGLDVSQRMCQAARAGLGCPVVRGDAQSLPFADGCFAGVGGLFYLQLVREVAQALAEGRRVLARGGILAFVMQASDWSEDGARALARNRGAGQFEGEHLARCARVAPGSSRYADDDLAAMLENAGLRQVSVERELEGAVVLARGVA